MPLPGNLSTITVTATYLDYQGNPMSGTVTFTGVELADATAPAFVMPQPVVATLNGSGHISVVLPVTDDPDATPAGYTYQITEQFSGGITHVWFTQLSSALGASVDLATLPAAAQSLGVNTKPADFTVADIATRNALTGMSVGSFCWVTNVDRLYRYDGTAWQPLSDDAYVLVNDFAGCDPTGATDSSAAVALALAAAKAKINSLQSAPAVAFLPGHYVVNNVLLDTTTTTGAVTVVGLGGCPDDVWIDPNHDGVTPSFNIVNRLAATTFKNMKFNYGRAFKFFGCANITLDDVQVAARIAGAAPIQVTNSFWFYWVGSQSGCQNGDSTPAIEIIGDSFNGAPNADTSYLTHFRDFVLTGGGIRLIQSGNSSGSSSNHEFRNMTGESFAGNMLVTADLGKAYYDASITNGSTALVCPSGDFTGADIGLRVAGPGIPVGTTITAVANTTHATMSAAATFSANPFTLVLSRGVTWGSWSNLIFDTCAIYDDTGDTGFLRSNCNSSAATSSTFINCGARARVVHRVGGNAFATWIGGFSETNYVITDAAGDNSTQGYWAVYGGSTDHTNAVAAIRFSSPATGVVSVSSSIVTLLHPPSNQQTGTTYTLALTDDGGVVECNNASTVTVTVPANASVPFPIGTQIELYQQGAGQVLLSGAGGVTVRLPNGAKTRVQFSTMRLRKRATDEWVLSGDTTV